MYRVFKSLLNSLLRYVPLCWLEQKSILNKVNVLISKTLRCFITYDMIKVKKPKTAKTLLSVKSGVNVFNMS